MVSRPRPSCIANKCASLQLQCKELDLNLRHSNNQKQASTSGPCSLSSLAKKDYLNNALCFLSTLLWPVNFYTTKSLLDIRFIPLGCIRTHISIRINQVFTSVSSDYGYVALKHSG